MAWNTIRVLMWKHLKVRVRRFIRTTMELLSPLLLFLILFLLRDKLKPQSKYVRAMEETIVQPEAYNLEDSFPPNGVFYYPKTNLTDNIMALVADKLHLRRLGQTPGTHSKGYYGIETDEEFARIAENLGLDQSIVIFQNMNGTSEYPRKLNYTIRMKENFLTHLYESLDEADATMSHHNFGAIYETFMRLQWSIDSSYLELLSSTPVRQRLTLQEFPYVDRSSSTDVFASTLVPIINLICIFSLMLMFVFLLTTLLEERSNGIQELIKMVGVTPVTLSISHFLNTIPCSLVYSVGGSILLTGFSNPLLSYCSPVLICVALLLHVASVVAMGFACSFLVRSTKYAASISFTAYVLLFFPYRFLPAKISNGVLLYLVGLLPHMPLHWFWNNVAQAELLRQSASLTEAAAGSLSILCAYTFLLLQIGIFSALSWYLEKVRPGNYGVALPWNFLFQKSYWNPQKVTPDASLVDEDDSQTSLRDPQYFEEPPKNLDVGIKIVNVSKEYGIWPQAKNKVLHNVNLDIYKGEITVLLGHNGAGKTTLMSIITGMYNATAGDVYVNGLHTQRQKQQLHKNIGLCTQHNLFFPDLTVLEHVIFFTMLKGVSYDEARSSSLDLLRKLGIEDKKDSKSKELSGGMKRRLQLTCALAGGADVLVLDEPTSGLDVETRRELWDLLLTLRGDRTVLLTTHFMEEADALGDRIAVLHHGRLKCHATPMFLKKSIGSGYRLTLITEGSPNESQISSVVLQSIPDASVKERSINSISYNLPAHQTDHFPNLFNDLEAEKGRLGISSIGVGVSTLEEVFLRLCRDVDPGASEDETDSMAPEPLYKKATGPSLWLSLFVVLFKRQFKYTTSKLIIFGAFQLLLPLVMIYAITSSSNNKSYGLQKNRETTMNLDMYDNLARPKAFYNISSSHAANFRRVADDYPSVEFKNTEDVASDVLRLGKENKREYNKYLVGIELNDTDAKVLYTTTVRHAAPVALNLLSNILASNSLPWADGKTVTTSNHPIQGTFMMLRDKLNMPKSQENAIGWAFVVAVVLMSIKLNVITLPCQERKSGARHIHIMTGCPPAVYWLTTLTYHTALYVVTLAIPTIVAAAVLDHDHTTDDGQFLASLFFTLFCGAVSFFAITYLVSFFVDERSASIIMVVLVFAFGFTTPILISSREFLKSEDDPKWTAQDIVIAVFGYFIPMQNFALAFLKSTNVARLNAYCRLNGEACPALVVNEIAFDAKKCCASPGSNWLDPFSLGEYTPGSYIVVMFLQAVVYMCLVVLAQYGVFNTCWDRLWNKVIHKYKPLPAGDEDTYVKAERDYVDKVIHKSKNEIPDAMLVHDLHKNYYKCFSGNINAVKGINFSVKKGECFGLLGVNGAGKSTTFKMMTGEERPTRGQVYANGYFLHQDKFKYIWTLGYCPQFFGLDQFLTGRENLTLMLTLRGLNTEDVNKEVKQWISVVGLEKYADRKVSAYSGGCVRRLATAAGVSRGAPLSLLDEPTSGVDPSARRKVWQALRRGLGNDRSIVITSHSMDEMEALCHRIAIMNNGVIVALGTVSTLRATHAQGHAVMIKLRTESRAVLESSPETAVQRLKGEMHDLFNCTLKDEHKTMVHYHINETIPYSQLFSKMEQLKNSFSIVEDYSVTETTLEEVFLSLAKEPSRELAVEPV